MRRFISLASVLVTIASLFILGSAPATARPGPVAGESLERRAEIFEQFAFGPASQPLQPANRLTECPQAGLTDRNPRPLDRRKIDAVEQISNQGDDVRVNQDYSCFPQNETALAINPHAARNIVAGQNDYRLGWGSSGVDASSNFGRTWYDGLTPFPSPGSPLLSPVLISDDHIDGGGDPVPVFDRAGVAYYAQIHFERERDDNGIFVNRSTNGGFTWSRPCVPIDSTNNPADDEAVCGGPGDPRQPGDGVVVFDKDANGTDPGGAAAFHDKEWMAAGPRPAGVQPVCFGPETHQPVTCDADVIGVDRLYVTWTRFDSNVPTAEIALSYSDDQGRSWSAPKIISGSAPFCIGGVATNCDDNQFSVPTVHQRTGYLYVAFMNDNTPDESQYLLVRSTDGGQTFQGPFFVTPLFTVNYPNAGGDRPDCTDRGQQSGRMVLTNSCFRVNPGGAVVVDKRGSLSAALHQANNSNFADDLYLVVSDNRNGSNASSNTDVFFFRSTDGGMTWIGPTRVNNDRSQLIGPRDCTLDEGGDCPEGVQDFGNDQWFPWLDIGPQGALNIVFHDRRKDRDSTRHEWPTSRERPGNYLSWFFGAQCTINTTGPITTPAGRKCSAPGAAVIPQPPAVGGIDPGADPQPGQGNQFVGPFRNFQISDVPFNLDYSFRAGIFMGDYNGVVVRDGTAYGFWTDSRNGRSSGGPGGNPAPDAPPSQPGRNPFCEQADVFIDSYSATEASTNPLGTVNQRPFEVTLCPQVALDRRGDDDDDDDDDDD